MCPIWGGRPSPDRAHHVTPYPIERLRRLLLDEAAVLAQEHAEEDGQVLDELLLGVLAVGVRLTDVGVDRQHLWRRRRRGVNVIANINVKCRCQYQY